MKFVPKQIDKIMNVFFSNKNFKKILFILFLIEVSISHSNFWLWTKYIEVFIDFFQVTDDSFQSFLDGWRDNRVRAIFFSSKSQPSLRFLAPAFFYRDRIACGFVHTGDLKAEKLVKQYSVNKYRETLLLWNEVTDSTLATIVVSWLCVLLCSPN